MDLTQNAWNLCEIAMQECRNKELISSLKAEVERLNADIEKIGTADDPLWIKACELKAKVERRQKDSEMIAGILESTLNHRDKLRSTLERLKRINIHEAPNFHNRVTVESIRIIDEALKGGSHEQNCFWDADLERLWCVKHDSKVLDCPNPGTIMLNVRKEEV